MRLISSSSRVVGKWDSFFGADEINLAEVCFEDALVEEHDCLSSRTCLTNSGLGSHAQHFDGVGAVSAIYETASNNFAT